MAATLRVAEQLKEIFEHAPETVSDIARFATPDELSNLLSSYKANKNATPCSFRPEVLSEAKELLIKIQKRQRQWLRGKNIEPASMPIDARRFLQWVNNKCIKAGEGWALDAKSISEAIAFGKILEVFVQSPTNTAFEVSKEAVAEFAKVISLSSISTRQRGLLSAGFTCGASCARRAQSDINSILNGEKVIKDVVGVAEEKVSESAFLLKKVNCGDVTQVADRLASLARLGAKAKAELPGLLVMLNDLMKTRVDILNTYLAIAHDLASAEESSSIKELLSLMVTLPRSGCSRLYQNLTTDLAAMRQRGKSFGSIVEKSMLPLAPVEQDPKGTNEVDKDYVVASIGFLAEIARHQPALVPDISKALRTRVGFSEFRYRVLLDAAKALGELGDLQALEPLSKILLEDFRSIAEEQKDLLIQKKFYSFEMRFELCSAMLEIIENAAAKNMSIVKEHIGLVELSVAHYDKAISGSENSGTWLERQNWSAALHKRLEALLSLSSPKNSVM